MTQHTLNWVSLAVVTIIVALGYYLILALLTWTICWSFGVAYSFTYPLGVIALILLQKSIKD